MNTEQLLPRGFFHGNELRNAIHQHAERDKKIDVDNDHAWLPSQESEKFQPILISHANGTCIIDFLNVCLVISKKNIQIQINLLHNFCSFKWSCEMKVLKKRCV